MALKKMAPGFRLIRVEHLDTVICIIHHYTCGMIKGEPHSYGVACRTNNGPGIHSVLAGFQIT
jgi:hypothetical protein